MTQPSKADSPEALADTGEPATLRLVPAVERAVQIVDFLARQDAPIGPAELGRVLGLPKSSLHGLLATLATLGLVIRHPGNAYSLGTRVLQWAGDFASQSGLVTAFHALAADEPALASETLMLATLEGADVVYLACRQGDSPLAVNFRVGGRFPACCTSSGKAILSSFASARVAALHPAGVRRLTRHSVDSLASLQTELERTRTAGAAIDDEETAEGMLCIAAPIRAAGQDEATAAIAVGLVKATLVPERRSSLEAAVRRLAARVSERLGARA